MRVSKVSARSLALFTLLLAAGAEANDPEDREYGSAAIHRSFVWRAPVGSGQAQGLHLFDMVPAGFVERVLVGVPAGRTLRITKTLDPRRGQDACELLDDTTGWWARVELDFSYRADTLGRFFTASETHSTSEDPAPVNLRFSAAGFSAVQAEVRAIEPAAFYAAVVRAIVASGRAAELTGKLPEGLAQAVLFLDASLSPTMLPHSVEDDNLAYGARGVVEVLAGVLRAAAPEGLDLAPTTWPMTVGPIQRGVSSSDPAVLELVSRFRSVENADPLSDHRAARVFGDAPPPG